MFIDVQEAVKLIKAQQNIVILSHKNPDGDTLGSAFGLYHTLKQLGKQVAVLCSDPFPQKFGYFCEPQNGELPPNPFIVAVDVADEKLLGDPLEGYVGRVDLCIDHHISNKNFATRTLLDATAAAACEIVYRVVCELMDDLPPTTLNALYTGIATDTGCFKFSNVTANTHRIAADLIERGAQSANINEKIFETISEQRVLLERLTMETLEYAFDKQVAFITITQGILETSGALEDEVDGIAALPRRIEGVKVAVVLREQPDDVWKVSLRSKDGVNVSAVASSLGGGGHVAAAGVRVRGTAQEAKDKLKAAIAPALGCDE